MQSTLHMRGVCSSCCFAPSMRNTGGLSVWWVKCSTGSAGLLGKTVQHHSNIEDASCFARSLLYPSPGTHPIQTIRWSVGTVSCETIGHLRSTNFRALGSWESRAVYWAFWPQWQLHKPVLQASNSLCAMWDLADTTALWSNPFLWHLHSANAQVVLGESSKTDP